MERTIFVVGLLDVAHCFTLVAKEQRPASRLWHPAANLKCPYKLQMPVFEPVAICFMD